MNINTSKEEKIKTALLSSQEKQLQILTVVASWISLYCKSSNEKSQVGSDEQNFTWKTISQQSLKLVQGEPTADPG